MRKVFIELAGMVFSAFLFPNACKEVKVKMDSFTKERVNYYINLLDEISEKTDNEQATVAVLHEICKDRRSMQIREEREGANGNGATFKQKRFMKKLGIDIPDEITRKEASALIDSELEKLK